MKLINQNATLAEFGVDSMITQEIKQTLQRDFNVSFTASEIRNFTFAKLIELSSTNISDDNMQDETETKRNQTL